MTVPLIGRRRLCGYVSRNRAGMIGARVIRLGDAPVIGQYKTGDSAKEKGTRSPGQALNLSVGERRTI